MVATRFKKTQGGQTRRKGAQGQGKTGPKAGVLVPGEWQEPQRWVSSTRNRLQLKDSRKADAAVKIGPGGCRAAMRQKKVLSLGPAVAFSLNTPSCPQTLQSTLQTVGKRATHLFRSYDRVYLDNHHTGAYSYCIITVWVCTYCLK